MAAVHAASSSPSRSMLFLAAAEAGGVEGATEGSMNGTPFLPAGAETQSSGRESR